jgi:hypothetical protein
MKMNSISAYLKPSFALLLVALICTGCGGDTATEKTFVGKWKSSKLENPVYLYDNGEWEIRTADGAILQYGVWQYKDNKIRWSFKADSHVEHDVNAVVSATPKEFQVKESDGTTTTFSRLD